VGEGGWGGRGGGWLQGIRGRVVRCGCVDKELCFPLSTSASASENDCPPPHPKECGTHLRPAGGDELLEGLGPVARHLLPVARRNLRYRSWGDGGAAHPGQRLTRNPLLRTALPTAPYPPPMGVDGHQPHSTPPQPQTPPPPNPTPSPNPPQPPPIKPTCSA